MFLKTDSVRSRTSPCRALIKAVLTAPIFAVLVSLMVFAPAAPAKEMMKDLDDFNYLLSEGILQGMLAKEMCTCRFLIELPLETCQNHSSLPEMLFKMVTFREDPERKTLTVYPAVPLSSAPAMAVFNVDEPQKGCRLVYGIREYENGYRSSGAARSMGRPAGRVQ